MAFAASTPPRVTSAQVPLLPVIATDRKKDKRRRRKRSNTGGGNESKSHGRPLLVTLRIEILRRGLFRLILLASLMAASFHLLHVHRTTLLSKMTTAVLLRFGSATSQPEPPQRTDDPTPKIPRLTVGIATVPREEKYLLATLDSWLRQLPVDPGDALYDSVRIVVMNATPDRKHRWFDRAKKKYSPPHPMSSYVVFVDKDAAHPPVEDPKPGVMDEGDANVPGYRVRRQTRDIVALLRHSAVTGRNVTAAESEGEGEGEGGGVGSGYFLFSEDDMELCDHGLSAIRHALAKSELRFDHGKEYDHGEKPPPGSGVEYGDDGGKGFVALRVSFGMNGILLHHHRQPGSSPEDNDVSNLADYLEEHQVRRPPDHLAVEWFAGETDQSSLHKNGRVNAAFRYNLFNHLGVSSTLREEKSNAAHFPGCYEELGEPVLFEVESFDFGSCPPDKDLWPCPHADAEAAVPRADRVGGDGKGDEDGSDAGNDTIDDSLGKDEATMMIPPPTIAWGRLCTSGKRCLNVKNPARRRMEAAAAAKAKAKAEATTTTGEALRKKHQPPASLVAAVAKYRPQ